MATFFIGRFLCCISQLELAVSDFPFEIELALLLFSSKSKILRKTLFIRDGFIVFLELFLHK